MVLWLIGYALVFLATMSIAKRLQDRKYTEAVVALRLSALERDRFRSLWEA